MTTKPPDYGKAAMGCAVIIVGVAALWITVVGLIILTRWVL